MGVFFVAFVSFCSTMATGRLTAGFWSESMISECNAFPYTAARDLPHTTPHFDIVDVEFKRL
jgi:hypothetical protein